MKENEKLCLYGLSEHEQKTPTTIRSKHAEKFMRSQLNRVL